jgi:predicted DNA-binding transcriptional regulator AlpA
MPGSRDDAAKSLEKAALALREVAGLLSRIELTQVAPGAAPRVTIRPDVDLLLDEKVVAKLLGVKPNTLSVWRTTKRYALPYVKIGSLVRYKTSEVNAFIAAHSHDA